jgi:hypothetical protein
MNYEFQPLGMRRVTDWLIRQKQINPGLDLKANNLKTGDIRYTEKIIGLLKETPLLPTKYDGQYVWLNQPAGMGGGQVAAKVMNPEMIHYSDYTSYDDMFAVVFNPALFKIDGKNIRSYSDLNPREKNFLLMATVHTQYEQLFPDFVLPSIFISYRTPYDVIGYDSAHTLEKQNKPLNIHPKNIYCKAGSQIFLQVQDFTPVMPLDWESGELTLNQIMQLSVFAGQLDQIVNNGGPLPDLKLFNRLNTNLGFSQTKRLVLLDSNHFMTDECCLKPWQKEIIYRYTHWKPQRILEFNQGQALIPA